MTRNEDEATWRNRFIAVNLVRIGGTIITLVGLVVWHGDWVRQGGHAALGFPMAIAGLVISFGAPIWLARRWKTPPGQ
jgi:hypothetical protein